MLVQSPLSSPPLYSASFLQTTLPKWLFGNPFCGAKPGSIKYLPVVTNSSISRKLYWLCNAFQSKPKSIFMHVLKKYISRPPKMYV